MPEAGEVVLIPFPFTDLSATKRRPVLVLRSPDALGDFLAIAVTSRPGHDDAVSLSQPDLQTGMLPKPSFIRTTKLYTLNERCIVRKFGTLKPDAFTRVHRAVCAVLACENQPGSRSRS
jgi:mRNA interferase MazF